MYTECHFTMLVTTQMYTSTIFLSEVVFCIFKHCLWIIDNQPEIHCTKQKPIAFLLAHFECKL